MNREKKDQDLSLTSGKEAVALEHGPVKMGKDASAAELDQGEKKPYPWYIIFILGNEFCERFSYYGMKAVLTLYFLEVLLWPDNTTTLIYHLFSVLCYFTPIFGAMLADGFLGKFNTIFSLSIVYVGGLVLLTLAAVPPLNLNLLAGTACGLVLIGFGTGGIKPVVPAYGGDQFVPGQEKQREQFFSIFYFCINAGSLISTFLTPILRSDVPCFGAKGCYPLAFGLPAGLMVVALIAFALGRPFYRNVPSKVNVIAKVFGVCFHAIGNKFRRGGKIAVNHWLDRAEDKYERDFIKDVKQLLPVLKMFLPLPMFWALFDQQGSRWTLQATRMDGKVTDDFYWKPDQVQIFNPVLILILIPIFETFIFPLFDKFKIPFKALSRMTVGMVFAGIAFIVAGVLQLQLDATLPVAPGNNIAEIQIYNTIPCAMHVSGDFRAAGNIESQLIPGFQNWTIPASNVGESRIIPFNATFQCGAWGNASTSFHSLKINQTHVHSVFLGEMDGMPTYRHAILQKKEKPEEGRVLARFVVPFGFNTLSQGGNLLLINPILGRTDDDYSYSIPMDRKRFNDDISTNIMEGEQEMGQGKYQVWIPDQHAAGGRRKIGENLELKNGGVFTVGLKNETSDAPWWKHDIVPPSTLSLFWQLPQYFIMTVGEVLFSVSGLSFAYSQAPPSMKSVLQAGWLMTVAVGNVIVIIVNVAGASYLSGANEYFLFAGLIGLFAIIFAVMCRYYKYIDHTVVVQKKEKEETDSM